MRRVPSCLPACARTNLLAPTLRARVSRRVNARWFVLRLGGWCSRSETDEDHTDSSDDELPPTYSHIDQATRDLATPAQEREFENGRVPLRLKIIVICKCCAALIDLPIRRGRSLSAMASRRAARLFGVTCEPPQKNSPGCLLVCRGRVLSPRAVIYIIFISVCVGLPLALTIVGELRGHACPRYPHSSGGRNGRARRCVGARTALGPCSCICTAPPGLPPARLGLNGPLRVSAQGLYTTTIALSNQEYPYGWSSWG